MKVKEYHWLNDEHVFLLITRFGKPYKYILTLENNKIARIDTPGSLVHSYPKDQNKVLFSRSKRNRIGVVYSELYLINISDLKKNNFEQAEKIKHNGSKIRKFYYDPNDNKIYTRKIYPEKETMVIEQASLDEGKWKVLVKFTKKDINFTPVGVVNEDTIAVLTNEKTDKIVLQEYNYQNKTFGKIIYQHPKFDLTNAIYSSNGTLNHVSFYQNGLAQRIYFEDQQSLLSERFNISFAGNSVYIVDRNANNTMQLLYVNGPTIPGKYFMYYKDKDVIHHLFNSYYNLNYEFTPSQLFKVTSTDGTEIEAYLTQPTENNLNTLLVMPHGGPIGIREHDHFNKKIQYFVSRGFSVLRVNFRGSAGFGKAFQNQGVGEFGKLIEEDISLAVDKVLTTHSYKNMCSIGSSYGGYSAVMLAIKNPQLYHCVIGAFGIYDLPLLFNASNFRSGEKFSKRISKVVGEYDKSLYDVSPVNLVNKLQAPILLIAGRKDDRADFEHTNRFKYLLKKADHDVQTMFYDKTGHGHSSWKGNSHEAALTYHFIMNTLNLPYPTPAQLSEKGKLALGSDFSVIADEFDTGFYSKKNVSKAFDYYNKAYEYGHSKSAFKIGAYLLEGKGVKKNIPLAIDYFQKAAASGDSQSLIKLGQMKVDKRYGKRQWGSALALFEKAHKLDPSAKSAIWLARILCSAPEPYKNIDRCINLFNVRKYELSPNFKKGTVNSWIHNALAWTIMEGSLNSEELIKLQKYSKNKLDLDSIDVALEDIKIGRFTYDKEKDSSKRKTYIFIDENNNIPTTKAKNQRVAIRFKADAPGFSLDPKKVAVIGRITYKLKNNKTQQTYHMFYGQLDRGRALYKSTKNIKPNETITLELYDMNQNKLASVTFTFNDKNQS